MRVGIHGEKAESVLGYEIYEKKFEKKKLMFSSKLCFRLSYHIVFGWLRRRKTSLNGTNPFVIQYLKTLPDNITNNVMR